MAVVYYAAAKTMDRRCIGIGVEMKHKLYTVRHAPGFNAVYACKKCGLSFCPGPDGGYWEEGPKCSVPDGVVIETETVILLEY